MEKNTTTIAQKVGASVVVFVIYWQPDPSALKKKMKMNVKETRRIYIINHVYFI